MAWQGARLRPSRYSASGGSRRPPRKIEHRSLPPASIAASDSVRTERKGERRPLAPRRSGMSPNASHRVRPGLSSAASLMTTLLISFDQEVLNQHLNLVTPEYPFFECTWREAVGEQGRSADPLKHREGDQPRQVSRKAAERGACHKQEEAARIEQFPPDYVSQPPEDRQKSRHGDQISDRNPAHGIEARIEHDLELRQQQ